MTNGSTETGSGTPTTWTPVVREPSPETRELARFHPNGTWTGIVNAGGMGVGSPAMDAKGKATCEWIIGGLWLSCDFEQDQFFDGKKVLTWKARWIAGWDPGAGEYRAVGVDSNGASFIFGGKIAGEALVMESLSESPVKLRFTWDASDPGVIRWKNEISVSRSPYRLIEEYVITPER
jgi:hypothetical protein